MDAGDHRRALLHGLTESLTGILPLLSSERYLSPKHVVALLVFVSITVHIVICLKFILHAFSYLRSTLEQLLVNIASNNKLLQNNMQLQ